MSATLESNNVSGSWKKRQRDEDEIKELKRPRLYYFRLASESSKCSEDDTESICSLQERSTDVIRDTSDTDSRADDLSEYEVEIEYEVASSSDADGSHSTVSSTDSEGMVLSAAAAFIIDTSLETWVTDIEDSEDGNSSEETSFGTIDFWNCIQCNEQNDNPLYRYCEKCFQARKRIFPPRPRRTKRRRNKKDPKKLKQQNPVKLDLLRTCLSGLSQDSGIGSSQECPVLDLDQINVPDVTGNDLTAKDVTESGISETSKESITNNKEKTNKNDNSEPSSSSLEQKDGKYLSKSDLNVNNGLKSHLNELHTKRTLNDKTKHHTLASEKNCNIKQTPNNVKPSSSSDLEQESKVKLNVKNNKLLNDLDSFKNTEKTLNDNEPLSSSGLEQDIMVHTNVKNSKLSRNISETMFDDSVELKRTNQTSTPNNLTLKQGKTYFNLDRAKTRRKRTFSESSSSEIDEVKKPRISNKYEFEASYESSQNVQNLSQNSLESLSQNSVESSSQGSSLGPSLSQGSIQSQPETELCLFCNNAPKDSIFLHTNIAHRCCCYKCAKKTLKTTKRCPICNRAVNKVLKIFTS